MKSSFAGQEMWPAGSIQELQDSEADSLVKHGYAELMEDEPPEEKRQTRVQKPKRR